MKQRNDHWRLCTAWLALVAFTLTSLTSASIARAETPAVSSNIIHKDFSSLRLPESLARIETVFDGYEKAGRSVIVIQDAHSIPDAQRSIRKIILFLEKEYGAELIGVEGASGDLDTRIFQSYPDQEKLQEVFKDYMDKGEMTGSVAAAIFGLKKEMTSRGVEFFGVEDWPVYEEGLALYLAAMGDEQKIVEKVESQKSKVKEEKEKNYSKELLEVDTAEIGFQENSKDLLAYLKTLAAIEAPEAGSEIALLLNEADKGQADDAALDAEVRRLAARLKLRLGHLSPQGQKAFNEKHQAFQISQISAAQFALALKDLSAKEGFKLPMSQSMAHQAFNQRRMRDLEGTKLFEDIEVYTKGIKESLFRNDIERQLDQRTHEHILLTKWAKLELSREDWSEIRELWIVDRGSKETSVIPAEAGIPVADPRVREDDRLAAFKYHKAFYENAEKRDAAFIRNLEKRLKPGQTAIMIAGGFHAQGLAEHLKAKGIDYALVMPNIEKLPEVSAYREHMKGNVDWKSYFEVKNGKINLYEAFVRYTRDRLLRTSRESSVVSREESQNPRLTPQDPRLLKDWRDQIIRNLADEGKLAKAGEYTRFIDETLQDKKKKDLEARMQDVEKFITGLKDLDAKGSFTAANIAKLLQPGQSRVSANKAATAQVVWSGPAGVAPTDEIVSQVLYEGALLPTSLSPLTEAGEAAPAKSEVRSVGEQIATIETLVQRILSQSEISAADYEEIQLEIVSPLIDAFRTENLPERFTPETWTAFQDSKHVFDDDKVKPTWDQGNVQLLTLALLKAADSVHGHVGRLFVDRLIREGRTDILLSLARETQNSYYLGEIEAMLRDDGKLDKPLVLEIDNLTPEEVNQFLNTNDAIVKKFQDRQNLPEWKNRIRWEHIQEGKQAEFLALLLGRQVEKMEAEQSLPSEQRIYEKTLGAEKANALLNYYQKLRARAQALSGDEQALQAEFEQRPINTVSQPWDTLIAESKKFETPDTEERRQLGDRRRLYLLGQQKAPVISNVMIMSLREVLQDAESAGLDTTALRFINAFYRATNPYKTYFEGADQSVRGAIGRAFSPIESPTTLGPAEIERDLAVLLPILGGLKSTLARPLIGAKIVDLYPPVIGQWAELEAETKSIIEAMGIASNDGIETMVQAMLGVRTDGITNIKKFTVRLNETATGKGDELLVRIAAQVSGYFTQDQYPPVIGAWADLDRKIQEAFRNINPAAATAENIQIVRDYLKIDVSGFPGESLFEIVPIKDENVEALLKESAASLRASAVRLGGLSAPAKKLFSADVLLTSRVREYENNQRAIAAEMASRAVSREEDGAQRERLTGLTAKQPGVLAVITGLRKNLHNLTGDQRTHAERTRGTEESQVVGFMSGLGAVAAFNAEALEEFTRAEQAVSFDLQIGRLTADYKFLQARPVMGVRDAADYELSYGAEYRAIINKIQAAREELVRLTGDSRTPDEIAQEVLVSKVLGAPVVRSEMRSLPAQRGVSVGEILQSSLAKRRAVGYEGKPLGALTRGLDAFAQFLLMDMTYGEMIKTGNPPTVVEIKENVESYARARIEMLLRFNKDSRHNIVEASTTDINGLNNEYLLNLFFKAVDTLEELLGDSYDPVNLREYLVRILTYHFTGEVFSGSWSSDPETLQDIVASESFNSGFSRMGYKRIPTGESSYTEKLSDEWLGYDRGVVLKYTDEAAQRREFKSLTGFDPEAIRDTQYLFSPSYFYYSRLVKEQVNPENQDLTVVYGDLRYNSNIAILLTETNATKAYFAARNRVTLKQMQFALERWDRRIIRERAEGLMRSVNPPLSLGGFTQRVPYGKNFANAVVNELKGLGLQREDVELSRDEKGRIVLQFPWVYPGTQEKKVRRIVFSNTELTDEKERKKFIQTIEGEIIHIYYEHPGQIALDGESLSVKGEHPEILVDMGNLLVLGGRILTDQYDSWGGLIDNEKGPDEEAVGDILTASFSAEAISSHGQWWGRGIPESHRLGFSGNTRIFKKAGGELARQEKTSPPVEQLLPQREQPIRFSGDTEIDFNAVPDGDYFAAHVKKLADFGMIYLKAFVNAVNYPEEVMGLEANQRIQEDPTQLIQEAFDYVIRIRQGEERADEERKALGFTSKSGFDDLSQPENMAAIMSYLAFGEILPWDAAGDSLKKRLEKEQSLKRLFDGGLPQTTDAESVRLQEIAYKDSKRARGILLESATVFSLIYDIAEAFRREPSEADRRLTFDQFVAAVQDELRDLKATWSSKPKALVKIGDTKRKKKLRKRAQEGSPINILIEDDLKGIKQLAERALNMAFGYSPQNAVGPALRSEMRSLASEPLLETYPGRDLFSAENVLVGTELWEEFKKLNKGKDPQVIRVSAESPEAAKASFDQQVLDLKLDPEEIVYVYFQVGSKGRVTHLVNVDKRGAISAEKPAPLGKHPFVLAWIEDSIVQNLHFTRVSLGKNEPGPTDAPLRGRGLMKSVYEKMEQEIKSRLPGGWTISALALDESGSVQEFLSHFSGVRPVTTAQEVILTERGYEKIETYDSKLWEKFVMGRITTGRDRLESPALGDDSRALENFLNEKILEIQTDLTHLQEETQRRLVVLQASWNQEISDAPGKARNIITRVMIQMRDDRGPMLEDLERGYRDRGLDYAQELTKGKEKGLLESIEYRQKIIKSSMAFPLIVLENRLHYFEAALRSLRGGDAAAVKNFTEEENAERIFDGLAKTSYSGGWNFQLRARDRTGRWVENWNEAEALVLEVRLKMDVVGQIALDRTQLQLAGGIHKVLSEKLESLKPENLQDAQESFRASFLEELSSLSKRDAVDISTSTRDHEEISFYDVFSLPYAVSKKIVLIDLVKSSEAIRQETQGERETLEALIEAQLSEHFKAFKTHGTVDMALYPLERQLRPLISLWVEVGVNHEEFENQLKRGGTFFTYKKDEKALNDILAFLLFRSDASPRAENEREVLFQYMLRRIAELKSPKNGTQVAVRSELRSQGKDTKQVARNFEDFLRSATPVLEREGVGKVIRLDSPGMNKALRQDITEKLADFWVQTIGKDTDAKLSDLMKSPSYGILLLLDNEGKPSGVVLFSQIKHLARIGLSDIKILEEKQRQPQRYGTLLMDAFFSHMAEIRSAEFPNIVFSSTPESDGFYQSYFRNGIPLAAPDVLRPPAGDEPEGRLYRISIATLAQSDFIKNLTASSSLEPQVPGQAVPVAEDTGTRSELRATKTQRIAAEREHRQNILEQFRSKLDGLAPGGTVRRQISPDPDDWDDISMTTEDLERERASLTSRVEAAQRRLEESDAAIEKFLMVKDVLTALLRHKSTDYGDKERFRRSFLSTLRTRVEPISTVLPSDSDLLFAQEALAQVPEEISKLPRWMTDDQGNVYRYVSGGGERRYYANEAIREGVYVYTDRVDRKNVSLKHLEMYVAITNRLADELRSRPELQNLKFGIPKYEVVTVHQPGIGQKFYGLKTTHIKGALAGKNDKTKVDAFVALSQKILDEIGLGGHLVDDGQNTFNHFDNFIYTGILYAIDLIHMDPIIKNENRLAQKLGISESLPKDAQSEWPAYFQYLTTEQIKELHLQAVRNYQEIEAGNEASEKGLSVSDRLLIAQERIDVLSQALISGQESPEARSELRSKPVTSSTAQGVPESAPLELRSFSEFKEIEGSVTLTYSQPIQLRLGKDSVGARSLTIISYADLIRMAPEFASGLNRDIEYYLIDPVDETHFKALRDDEEIIVGRDKKIIEAGRFKSLKTASAVSRVHLKINRTGNEFIITDMGSTNGTDYARRVLEEQLEGMVMALGGQQEWMAKGYGEGDLTFMIDAAIKGKIYSNRAGEYHIGQLVDGDQGIFAGRHGPYFALFSHHGELVEAPSRQSDFAHFLVPNESEKRKILEMFEARTAQEKNSSFDALLIRKKFLTYAEFIQRYRDSKGFSDGGSPEAATPRPAPGEPKIARSELRSKPVVSSYPGRDLFSAENVLVGTPLWEEFKKLNSGEAPAIMNIYAGSVPEADQDFKRQKSEKGLKEDAFVYVYYQIAGRGRIHHIVTLDKVKEIDANRSLELMRHSFMLQWEEDPQINNLHFSKISLGKGVYEDFLGLRGRGLLRPVFKRLNAQVQSRFSDWTISSLVLDKTGSVQTFLSGFSGVRHLTPVQQVVLMDRGYEKVRSEQWGNFVMGRITAARDSLDQPSPSDGDNESLSIFLNQKIPEIRTRLNQLREDVQNRIETLQVFWGREISDASRSAKNFVDRDEFLVPEGQWRNLPDDFSETETKRMTALFLRRIEYKQKFITDWLMLPVKILENQFHSFESALHSLQFEDAVAVASFKEEQNAERLFNKLAETGYSGAWNFQLRAKDRTGRWVESWSEAETLVLEVRFKTDVVGRIALDRTQLQSAESIHKVVSENLSRLKSQRPESASKSFRTTFLKYLAGSISRDAADIKKNIRDTVDTVRDMRSLLDEFSKKIVLIDLRVATGQISQEVAVQKAVLNGLLDARISKYLERNEKYGSVYSALSPLKNDLSPLINLWVELGVDRKEFDRHLAADQSYLVFNQTGIEEGERLAQSVLNDILAFLLFQSDDSPRIENEREFLLQYTMQRIDDHESKRKAAPLTTRSEVRTNSNVDVLASRTADVLAEYVILGQLLESLFLDIAEDLETAKKNHVDIAVLATQIDKKIEFVVTAYRLGASSIDAESVEQLMKSLFGAVLAAKTPGGVAVGVMVDGADVTRLATLARNTAKGIRQGRVRKVAVIGRDRAAWNLFIRDGAFSIEEQAQFLKQFNSFQDFSKTGTLWLPSEQEGLAIIHDESELLDTVEAPVLGVGIQKTVKNREFLTPDDQALLELSEVMAQFVAAATLAPNLGPRADLEENRSRLNGNIAAALIRDMNLAGVMAESIRQTSDIYELRNRQFNISQDGILGLLKIITQIQAAQATKQAA